MPAREDPSGRHSDGTEPDQRDLLALTQYLTVLDDLPEVAGDDGRYVVVSESGSTYLVDVVAGVCSCPDHRYRGGRCKHVRRVEFAIGARAVPTWIEGIDPDLGRHVDGPRHRVSDLATGDVVFDRRDDDRGSRMRVLRVLDTRADEYEIDPGRTVAEYNPEGDPADRVVEVVFEGDLDRHVPGWRDWPAGDLVSELDAYRREWNVCVRTYAFPRGRLTRSEA